MSRLLGGPQPSVNPLLKGCIAAKRDRKRFSKTAISHTMSYVYYRQLNDAFSHRISRGQERGILKSPKKRGWLQSLLALLVVCIGVGFVSGTTPPSLVKHDQRSGRNYWYRTNARAVRSFWTIAWRRSSRR
ncbi:histone H1/H5 family protein [Caballeronia hypogeia]|uniref:histone H1/H5 family protein n=1 Tax=Caballeronia hypogeia TaxID=1777140 RepID=UPI0009EE8264